MKKHLLFLIGICGAIAFTSCSSMYIPSMVNAPLLENKGEIQGEVSLSTNAIQLGGGYAITDHIAAMANVNISYGNFTNFYDIYTSKDADSSKLADLTNYGKFNNRHYEVGLGYYNMFNSEHFKMEAFGGLGFCNANDENKNHTEYSETYDSKYVMAFAQLNTGLSTKVCDFGLACRIAPTFHTFDWETNYVADKSLNASGTEHFTLWHVEPLLFLRLGYDHFKISAKAGISYPFETDAYKEAKEFIPNSTYTKTTLVHFSIGACFTFNNAK